MRFLYFIYRTMSSLLKIILLISALGSVGGLGAQPLLYLGVQGGTAVPDLQPAADAGLRSDAGSGRSLGLFMRYGRRQYYQFDVNWMRGRRTFLIDQGAQGPLMQDIPVRQFGMGAKIGYQWLRTPYLKGRADMGPQFGQAVLPPTPYLGGAPWREGYWSWRFGAGVDVLYFNLDLVYQHGLGRLTPTSAAVTTFDRLRMNVLLLLVGVHL